MTSIPPDLVVFEMANNHQGSLAHGLRIVDEMAAIAVRHGVRAAVKLQYRDLDTFIHPEFRGRTDVKHAPRFLETRLSWEEFHSLALAIHDRGMLLVITAFDERSVDKALDHGVDILKVASCSAMDWPLLEVVARSRRPVICSTGGCRLGDIDKTVSFFEHRDVAALGLLHCVGLYPTPDEAQQLHFMRRMMLRYPQCAVGYSGHEAPGNLRIAAAAVAMGARVLERHVGVPTEVITLNAYSMNPTEADRWVAEVVAARRLCGQPEDDKRISEAEVSSLRSLARGVWAKCAIKQGEMLDPGRIFLAMPVQDGQTTASAYLETMTASRDYAVGDPIRERRSYDPVFALRSVVHEAKGLLREARIALGGDYQIELSHHFGVESFRRVGATIVNIVNREYCKKLVILLPGQAHPSHYHRRKEETFQVLYGELDLELQGTERRMRPGDIQLVPRGEVHAFSTTTGCIFEEISTTHVKGDSVYEDPKIAKLDPVERKTIIDDF